MSLSAPSDTWCLRMDGIQWAWALFDAGCWGYASVTINTLVPLVCVPRLPQGFYLHLAPLPCWLSPRVRAPLGVPTRAIDGLPLSLPIQVFKQDAPKDEAKYVSAVWANTVAAGTLMSGLVCPFFGAILDMYGWRKAAVMTTSIAMCVCLSIFAQIRCCPDRARRLLASRPCRLCGHQPATRVRATACGH